jgi:VWFA-related protein
VKSLRTSRWLSVAAGTALAVAPFARCQMESAAPALRISQVQVSPDGGVRAIVSATDTGGDVISNLTEANFRVVAAGRPAEKVTVSHLAAGVAPISIVLAIDVSGSMRGDGLAAAVRGASAFVDRLNPGDRCALIVFGTGVRTVSGFTEDRDSIKQALAQLKANDARTYLYQAAFDAFDLAATAPTGRAAIVLLTDGKDEGSPLGLQEVVAKATVRDLPVFTLAYGSEADLGTLRRLAAVSHGRAYVAPSAAMVSQAYSDINKQLQTDYVLGFTLPLRPVSPFQVSIMLDYHGQSANAALEVTLGPAGPSSQPARSPGFPRVIWVVVIAAVLLVCAGGWFYWRQRSSGSHALAKTMVPPRVWLEVVKGADTGQKAILFEDEALIGRDGGRCQVVLKNDPLVGRQHARLSKNNRDQFVLEDLGSQNGTMVNGVRIKDGVTLQSDDRIVVGLSELLFIDHR